MPNQFLRHPNPTHTVDYRAEAVELAKSNPDVAWMLLELKGTGAYTWREIVEQIKRRLSAD